MDRFNNEDVSALESLIKRMDSRVGIEEIDYSKEVVRLNYTYNRGTSEEFVEHNFFEVNTSCDSVPCAIYEVVRAVFDNCVV